jgi:hypothetical protein
MPSDKTNEATRRDWRELEFFYDRDDAAKQWMIIGSREGLLKFANIISAYSRNPRNQQVSEHDHLGPYMYLEIGTWKQPIINEHWIAGTLDDLSRLATLIARRVSQAKEGDTFGVRSDFAPGEPYELFLRLESDGFDPASADEACGA